LDKKLLINLLIKEADLIHILANVERDARANKTNGVISIADLRFKLEKFVDVPYSYGEIRETCGDLIAHGLLVSKQGPQNSKLVCLSDSCKKIFEGLDELAGGLR
jgi:hypothetical protein